MTGRMQPSGPDAAWPGLFRAAFKRSRNAMVLLDDRRRHTDVNGAYIGLLGYPRTAYIGRPVYEFVAGGPLATEAEWRKGIAGGDFTGQADLVRSDGGTVSVQYAAHPATVAGGRLVLFVALHESRRGRNMAAAPRAAPGASALSPREMQVIGLLAQGDTSAEIANALHVSHNTVRTHVRNAMVKLDVRSRAQLVAKVMGEGLGLS